MASRMDRYNKPQEPESKSRIARHHSLYDDFSQNARYTEYTNVDNGIPIDLSGIKKEPKNREDYQRNKDVEMLLDRVTDNADSLSSILNQEPNKVYDINSVLAEAKKNRGQTDDLEQKRKLRNESLNILTSIDKREEEERKKPPKRKEDSGLDEEESKNLEELIHTIYDAAMTQKIKMEEEKANEPDQETEDSQQEKASADKEEHTPVIGDKQDASLLSDLMPSSNTETVLTGEISKEVIEEMSKTESTEEKTEQTTDTRFKDKNVDQSFYTRSMDLSDADFTEEDDSIVEKKSSVWLFIKILLVIILVVGIGILIFILINQL